MPKFFIKAGVDLVGQIKFFRNVGSGGFSIPLFGLNGRPHGSSGAATVG